MSELLNFLITHEDQFRRNRLAALYSDFRHLRTTNPDGYAANVEAWRKGLADAAKGGHIPNRNMSGDLLTLSIDENLLRALETKEWGRPLALGTVVRDLLQRKEIIPIREFYTARESIYHKSWALNPWEILSWGLRQIGLAEGQDGEDQLPVGRLVVLANVELAAKELSRRVNGLTTRSERIYSKRLFHEAFANVLGNRNHMTTADMDVLLRFMARDKGMLVYDGETVKLKGSTDVKNTSITSEDSTIASLKTLMQDLRTQVEGLSTRVEKLSVAVGEAIARKNRTTALAVLRTKKLVETNLSKQSATLFQLEEVYAKIGQAADQVELVHVLEGSTGVLKALNAEVGGVEKVDDVLYGLKEQMTEVEEVGNALTEASKGTADEDELDAELKAMEQQDLEKRQDAERLKREEQERLEVAQTKRNLESLEGAEKQAAYNHKVTSPDNLSMEQSIDTVVDYTTKQLGQMSLQEDLQQKRYKESEAHTVA